MPRTARSTPIAAFEDNMRDAHQLVRIADGLTNTRKRRMRRELRDRVGDALGIRSQHRDELDCLQSEHLFVTFLPGGALRRADFDDQRALLHQAIVAGCAATETYLADKVMTRIGGLLTVDGATPRLKKIPMDIGTWLEIEARYTRERWGLRYVAEEWVRQQASTAPSRIGELLSLIGVADGCKKLDVSRGVGRGDTETFLKRITDRRNKIAHAGDRVGQRRAQLAIDEVRADLACLESVVAAIEKVA